jgi:hypothetical protein
MGWVRCAQVIRGLVQRRREVKGLMASERDPLRRQQLDIRQQVAYTASPNMGLRVGQPLLV